jgi:predicted site-specific integrase-resolvase
VQRPRLTRPDRAAVPLKEAAARLGISYRHAHRLLRAGRFPVRAFRVDIRWHVDRAELERHLRGGPRGGEAR